MSKILKILLVFAISIFGGIFGSEILWPILVERPLLLKYKIETQPIYLIERKEVKGVEELEKELVGAKQRKLENFFSATVAIRTKKNGNFLSGCGLIFTNDGQIITLASLVVGKKTQVLVAERVYQPEILKIDKKLNLALLKIKEKNLRTVSFADFEKIKLGEKVFLIGKIQDTKMITFLDEGIIRNFDDDKIETNIFEGKNFGGGCLFDFEGNFLGLAQVGDLGRVFTISISKIKNFLTP